MKLVPVTKDQARAFIQKEHRHNEAPTKMQVGLAVGLENGDEELIGVATAGRPVARALADRWTLEVNRTCTLGDKNANSMLYGAIARAAKALGYQRLITYTLHEESGASLKASGFTLAADIGARSWADSSKARPRYDENLFGERRNAANAAKYRWEKSL